MNWADRMWKDALDKAKHYHNTLRAIGLAYYKNPYPTHLKKVVLKALISDAFRTTDENRLTALSVLALDLALPESNMTPEDRNYALMVGLGFSESY